MERCWLLLWICLLRMGAALTPRRTGVTPFFLPTCVYDGHLSPGSLVRRHPQRPGAAAAGASAGMMPLPNPLGGVFVLLAYTYDAPGKAPKGNDVSSCHQALTKPQEGVIGLYYDGYRWTKVGVWLSADPIKEDGGLNLYAYVGNDPVNGVDLWGLYEYGWDDAMLLPISPQLYILARTEVYAPSDEITDFAAGGSDSITLGLTQLLRWATDNNEVNTSSGIYEGNGLALLLL